MKKENTGIKDSNDKMIREGDLLLDNISTKGIVVISNGEHWVTTDYNGRDIKILDKECDILNDELVYYNKMVILGNIFENPELLNLILPPLQ
jgi:hypothetical protein